jgi:hypothetical protein
VRVVILHRLLDELKSLLPVVGKLANFFPVGDTQDHQETVDDITIELFIVDDQDRGSVQVRICIYFTQASRQNLNVLPRMRKMIVRREMRRVQVHVMI